MKHIKDLLGKKFEKTEVKHPVQELVDYYLLLRGWNDQSKEFYKHKGISYGRLCMEAKTVLTVAKDDLNEARRWLERMAVAAERKDFNWTLSTVIKKDLKIKI